MGYANLKGISLSTLLFGQKKPEADEVRPGFSWADFDAVLFLVAICLLMIGFIMIASASIHIADVRGEPFAFAIKQGIFLLLALVSAVLVVQIPVSWWRENGWLLLFVALLLLVVVLLAGKTVNGSTRWLRFGAFNIQPSEIAKLFLLAYLAGYLDRRREEVLESWWGFCKPLCVMFLASLLLLLEPDFGATFVIMAAAAGMIFLSGAKVLKFAALLGVISVLGTLLILWKPYRLQRLMSYVDPWADQYNTGYQLTQSLIAFGRGEWFGEGLGNSVQKLFYLPEAHTDFVFAILAEEFGLVGCMVVVVLFAVLVYRGLSIGLAAERQGLRFAAFLAYGVSLLLGIQAFINMGVNAGLLPTKGLTLPLVTYGGSSLIMSCVCVALLQRIHCETVNPALAKSSREGQE